MFVFFDLLDSDEDKGKFEKLYNTYANLLYYIAMQKLNCIEDAEECVQETFFYVAKHFDKIGEINSLSTKCYLSTIVSGYAAKTYNKSQKTIKIFEGEYDITENVNIDEFDDGVFDEFNQMELTQMIDNLDDDEKVYLYLTYIYGYKSNEIAQMYGVKDYTVRKRLYRAKQKLRTMYGKASD